MKTTSKKTTSKKATPKKSKKTSSGHKLFKTKEGVQELFNYEKDKYYLCMSGNVLVFNEKGIFSKAKAESCYDSMIVSLCEIVAMPKNHEEREDAIKSLQTLAILPFRVH